METNKLTNKQKMLYLGFILGPGILIQYCVDKFGDQLIRQHALSDGYLLLSSFVVITVMIILASRYIGTAYAKWTAVIASIFETVFAPMLVWPEQLERMWPPLYLLTIPFCAGICYLYAGLINRFVKQKYSA